MTAGRIAINALSVDHQIVMWDDEDRAGLILRGQRLPETLVTTISGRRLEEVVEHPSTRTSGWIKILSATNESSGMTMTLSSERTPVRPVPDGATDTWRTMPY